MRPRLSSFAVAGCLLVSVTFLVTARSTSAQVPQYYEGVVVEPELRVWFDASTSETHVVAVGESWSDSTDGEIRLEASFGYKGRSSTTLPRTVTLELVRVGPELAWKKSTRFKVLADGTPLAVTFSRREPAYSSRGVKIGVEESLVGNPATGTWAPMGDMNQARFSHTATVLQDGRVLAVGGVSNGDQPTAESL